MKAFAILALLFLLFLSCNPVAKEVNRFTIDGIIDGFDSSYVNLVKLENGLLITIDSALVSEGKFSFHGSVKAPDMYYLAFGNLKHRSKIFLDNSNIKFKAHYDSLDLADVSGSKCNDEFNAYEDEVNPYENKMTDLYQQFKAASDQGNHVLMLQLDSTLEALENDMNTFIKNYICTHKSSVISPFILYQVSYNMSVSEIDSILGILDKSLDSSIYSKSLKIRVKALHSIEPGKKAPEFVLNDTAGNSVSLSSFKGKCVLIDFWASWSGPCRRESSEKNKLYQEFNEKGFEILGISLDNDKESWIKAIKQDKMNWTQISDLSFYNSSVAKAFGINSIPCAFLINRDGIIVAKETNTADLRLKIISCLK